LNVYIDSIQANQFPINVVAPYVDNGVWNRNGMRGGVLVLQGWILTRIHIDPNDYRARFIEDQYIAEMRLKAKVFIQAMINSAIVNPEASNITDQIRPEYRFTNMHTFGVFYTLNLPIKEAICLPTS
jgi:hypothetical protein